jgi:very-short-patch-repair endonuclease
MIKQFSTYEINYLKRNYGNKRPKDIAKFLNRSISSIYNKGERLGLVSSFNHWTTSEDKLLKKYYGKVENKRLLGMFPAKTVACIAYRAGIFNLTLPNKNQKIWTEQEKKLLMDNYGAIPLTEIAKKLNRTRGSVTTKANKGLKLLTTPWTDKNVKYLKDNYLSMSDVNIAKELKLTKYQVSSKRNRLGLHRPYTNSTLEMDFLKFFEETYKFKPKVQSKIWKYIVDFQINNLLIELNGSYWHSDPRIYKNGPIYKKQIYVVNKDISKKKYLLEKKYNLLIIWEEDFYSNINKVKQLCDAFLRNKDEKLGKFGESLEEDNTEITN